MVRAVYVKSDKSCIKYGNMLKEASMDFERALYSWNMKQIPMRFTNLIFWVLALSFFSNDSDLDKIDLSYTIDIFTNKKYLDTFNKVIESVVIDYTAFAGFLQNPTNYTIIQLPLSYNSYMIVEFNKDNSKHEI
jgi:hypothetical protein